MCLSKAKRIKCKKDIVCYKLAFVSNHLQDNDFDIKTAVFKTLYQFEPIIFNKEESAIIKGIDIEIPTRYIENENGHSFEVSKEKRKTSIYGGMFHSYKKLWDAQIEANNEGFYCYVIKCTIPKDSILFKGKFCGRKSYASSKIVFNEVVYCNR